MNLRKNQRGFSPVEIILIIFVLGLVVAVGWLVYDRQKGKDTGGQNNSEITNFEQCVSAGNPVMESYPEQCKANGKTFVNEQQKTVSEESDETANWLTFTPKNKLFTVRLADGWEVYESHDGQGVHTFGSIESKPGTKARVMPYPGGRDGSTGMSLGYMPATEVYITPGSVKQNSLKTKEGFEIEKYHWIVSGYSSEGVGIGNGDTLYTYVIKKNASIAVAATYSFSPGDTDYHEVLEKVLSTVSFK